MDVQTQHHYTLEEYLQLEADTNCKYEYHAGQVYAMSGGTIEHAVICGNIFAAPRAALRQKGQDCRVFNGEAKVYIALSKTYVYPDAMVVCGGVEQSDEEGHALVNPTLVVEGYLVKVPLITTAGINSIAIVNCLVCVSTYSSNRAKQWWKPIISRKALTYGESRAPKASTPPYTSIRSMCL